ncbi:MAG: AAA family ATPase [Oscillospiraceae bacterium]|nr:AAA family ATPase [Oscillospiraceae bacterium]
MTQLRLPAEQQYQAELNALVANDSAEKPYGWRLSPRAVLLYITGGQCGDINITPKYIGHKRLVEIAIATLQTDRGLLLTGDPGTAKSWLSEHLCAAITGQSTNVIQGTMGTDESQIKYGWNYAMLIANGPTPDALIKSPVYTAMENGGLIRFEEISRCAGEVQDALIGIMSEKLLPIPELSQTVQAARGFNIIATANTRDRGIHTMSAALKRRFNTVILPSPETPQIEQEIVTVRVAQLSQHLPLTAKPPNDETIAKVIKIFRELRAGASDKEKFKQPSSPMSTAEAISLLINAMALSSGFGDGNINDSDLAAGLHGAIVKEEQDAAIFKEYLDIVIKHRDKPLYTACRELV